MCLKFVKRDEHFWGKFVKRDEHKRNCVKLNLSRMNLRPATWHPKRFQYRNYFSCFSF